MSLIGPLKVKYWKSIVYMKNILKADLKIKELDVNLEKSVLGFY